MKINYLFLIDAGIIVGLLLFGYIIFGCVVQVKKEASKWKTDTE